MALTCSINPAGSYNTTVYWTTNDPAVATVSSNGHTATINAVGYGSTVITARTADGNYTANCTVTVIYQYNIHESLFLGQMLDEELMNHQLTFNQARSILQCLQSNNGTISVEQLSAIMGFTCAQSGAHLIELTYATSLYNMSLGDAVFFYNQQLSSDRQTALSYLFFQVLTSISSGIRVTSPEFNPNSRLDMVEKNLLENGVTFKPLHGSLTAYKMPNLSYNGVRNSSADFRNGSTLLNHLNRHGSDFGYTSPEQYLNGARYFLEKPPTSTTQSFVSNQGSYFRYDTATNEFGIINSYGGISTYFKPNPGIDYWLEQVRLYSPD